MHVHQFRLGVIVAVASEKQCCCRFAFAKKHFLNEDKRFVPTYARLQSIGCSPHSTNCVLIFEYGLLPKKPR